MKYAFREFEFDGRTLELTSGGARTPLAPQAGLLLRLLLETAPDLLTREAAQAALWPDGPFADAEHGLNACIRQLRAALGDSAAAPGFIETLPKRGYRFIAEIRAEEAEAAPPSAGRARRALPRPLVLMAAALLVAVAVASLGALFAPPRAVEDAAIAEQLARAQAWRTRGRPGDAARAVALYEEVLRWKPRAVPALAGKALALALQAGRNPESRAATYAAAREFAAAAEAQAPHPDASAALGYARLYDALDAPDALRAFDEALRREPAHLEALIGRAAALSALGRHDDAVEAATAAMRRDPLSYSARSDRCWYLLFADRFDEALDACAWAREIDADHSYSHLGEALALRALDREDEARAAFRRYAAQRGLASGDGPAPDYCDAAAANAADRSLSAYERAALFGLCGAVADAAALLREAAENREPPLLFYAADPRFDGLRDRLPRVGIAAARAAAVDGN